MERLGALEANVRALGAPRNAALRMFLASRDTITMPAQRELWLEFLWIDQEYRAAVRRLSEFCLAHQRSISGPRGLCLSSPKGPQGPS